MNMTLLIENGKRASPGCCTPVLAMIVLAVLALAAGVVV